MPMVFRKWFPLLFLLVAVSCLPRGWSQTTKAPPATAPLSAADEVKVGIDFAMRGDLDSAIASFTTAIKTDPSFAVAYARRGFAYSQQHKNAEAMADFDEAIQLNPKSPEFYYQRGSAWGETGNFDAAISDFDHAIQLSPQYAAAYYNRGHGYYFKGDLKNALSDLDHSLALNPANAPGYWVRGLIYRAQGDRDKAEADFDASVKGGFSYGVYWLWIIKNEKNDSAGARASLASNASNAALFREEEWSTAIAEYLVGRLSQERFLARAGEGTDRTARLCEAWFYIGMNLRFAGDLKGDSFQNAIASGATQSEELVEARRQLRAPPAK